MWDTQYTDYKCTNTPAGRDLVREYVDAFRAEGLHVGLLLFPHRLAPSRSSPSTGCIPRRDDPDAEEQSQRPRRAQVRRVHAQSGHRAADQLRQDRRAVVRLLLFRARPGRTKPWMKGKGKDDWEAEKLLALARRLQPGIIIDNRTEIEQDHLDARAVPAHRMGAPFRDRRAGYLGGLPDLLRQLGLLSRRADLEEPRDAASACW